jgi:hypothetical protein
MKSISRFVLPAMFFAFVLALACGNAAAQGKHPAYLHALTDLRHARAHLQRSDGGALREEEKRAIHHIDEAINEIKRASIDDGKVLDDHPPVDLRMDWDGRLHRSRELLLKARHDIEREEDNAFAQGLQQRAFEHIDRAIHEVDEAIRIVASRS